MDESCATLIFSLLLYACFVVAAKVGYEQGRVALLEKELELSKGFYSDKLTFAEAHKNELKEVLNRTADRTHELSLESLGIPGEVTKNQQEVRILQPAITVRVDTLK
jgi:hypothetical protein